MGKLDIAAANKIRPLFYGMKDKLTDAKKQAKLLADLKKEWPHRSIYAMEDFTDSQGISLNFQWDLFFNNAKAQGVDLYPCIDYPDTPSVGVLQFVKTNGTGMAVRVNVGQLSAVIHSIGFFGVPQSDVDLIIDGGYLSDNNSATMLPSYLAQFAGYFPRFRSVTYSAGAFPMGVSGVVKKVMTAATTPRYEWVAYQAASGVYSDLIFGDYAIDHPVQSVFIPGMKVPAAIRYTGKSDWHIVRGHNMDEMGSEDIPDLCRYIVGRGWYSGVNFSWGDWDIDQRSQLSPGMKGATLATLGDWAVVTILRSSP